MTDIARDLIGCVKECPRTKAEMLQVSGGGEMKYTKYGEKFLEALNVREQ